MKSAVLLCTVLACTTAKPNGYYHQEYNYQTSSSSFKNNELQHRNDDEGYYSKDGDLEGRLRPKVNAHSQHSEYVNPKLQHGYRMGTDSTSSYGQLNAQDRFGRAEAGYNHADMGSSYGYAGATQNYGVSSRLREVTTSLQQELERELQNAVYDHYQRASAYGGSISQSQIEADRRTLEEELRRNVTMRLQEALKVQYGNQGVRGANSYSIVNGRLQATANYNNAELAELTRQMEANLMRHLDQQVQSYYHTTVNTAVHTQRNTYRHDNANVKYPGALQQRPPVYQPYPQSYPEPRPQPQSHPQPYPQPHQQPYPQPHQQPYPQPHQQPRPVSVDHIPDSITTVATRVQTELNEHLNKLLDETQRRYFTTNSYQTHGNTNYENILAQLQDQLRTNITIHFDDQIKRAYGYSNYATSKYSREDIDNLRRQIETNLITKLDRDFNRQREKFLQTQRVYEAPRPIPGNQMYYPATTVQHGQTDLATLQRQMQEQMSRQVQDAVMQQSYRQAHMYSGSASNYNAQANYQAALQQLTAELERNLTRQMEQVNAQQYQSGAYNSQLANMRHQLQNDLTRQLQQGLQQSYSRYSSWSSSSSSNSNYRPVRGYDPTQYQSYGVSNGASAMGDDCMMGDDPSVYQQQDNGDEDLTQQIETLHDHDLTQQVQTHDDLTQQTEDEDDVQRIQTHNQLDQADDLTQQAQTADDLTQQVQTQHDLGEPRAQYQQVQTSQPKRVDFPPEQQYHPAQTTDDIERPFEAQSVSHLYSKPPARQSQTLIRRDPLYDQNQDLTQQTQTLYVPHVHSQSSPVSYQSAPQYTSTYQWTQRQQPQTSRVGHRVQYFESLGQQRANQAIYTQQIRRQEPVSPYQSISRRPISQQTQDVPVFTQQSQQTQDLLGQQTEEDSAVFGRPQTPRRQEPLSQYQSISRRPIPQQTQQGPLFTQQSQQIGQQSEDFGQTQQTQDLLGQQTEDDTPGLVDDSAFGRPQTQQNQLPRRQEPLSQYQSISRRPIQQQTQQGPLFTQQSQQIGQQSDEFGQTQQSQDLLGQQTEDDTQGLVDDSAAFGRAQVGHQHQQNQQVEYLSQQNQLGQQVQDLTQQNQYNDFGPSQQTLQGKDLVQQTDDNGFAPLQIGGPSRGQPIPSSNYRWVTPTRKPVHPAQHNVNPVTQQQTQVLTNQQSDDLTQQSQDLTQQSEDLTQQSQDLTQQSEDLTQQSQDLTQTEQNQYLSQQSQDLNRKPHHSTQQTQDLTQQSEDLTQQSEDLTQQSQDLTQQSQDLTQQTDDFTEQNPYLSQQAQDLNRKPHHSTQQTQDLTQQSEDLTQQTDNYLSQQNQDLTQQSEDLTQQSQDLTQQSEDLTQQSQDLTQQSEDLTQQNQDLTQQNEDLTQQSQDLTQQSEDLTQKSQDLTQQSQDLTQQSQDIDQPIEPQVASNKIFKDDPSYQHLAQRTQDLIQQEVSHNQQFEEGPTTIPAFAQQNEVEEVDQDKLREADKESQRLIELIRNQARQNQQQQNYDIGPLDYSPKPVYADHYGQPVQVGTTRQLPHQIPEDTQQNTYGHEEPHHYHPKPVYDANGNQVGTTRQLQSGRSAISQPNQVKYGRPQQEDVNAEGVREIEPLTPQVAHEVVQVGEPVSGVPEDAEVTTTKPGFWSRLGTRIKNKIG